MWKPPNLALDRVGRSAVRRVLQFGHQRRAPRHRSTLRQGRGTGHFPACAGALPQSAPPNPAPFPPAIDGSLLRRKRERLYVALRYSTPRSQSRVCPVPSHDADSGPRITHHASRITHHVIAPRSPLWPGKEFSTRRHDLIPANGCSFRVNSSNPCLPSILNLLSSILYSSSFAASFARPAPALPCLIPLPARKCAIPRMRPPHPLRSSHTRADHVSRITHHVSPAIIH